MGTTDPGLRLTGLEKRCATCKKIPFDDLLHGSQYLARPDPYDTPVYHAGPAADFLARRAKCPFCAIVCAASQPLDISRDRTLHKLRIYISAQRPLRELFNEDAESEDKASPWPSLLEVYADHNSGMHISPTVNTLLGKIDPKTEGLFKSNYLGLCVPGGHSRSGSGKMIVVPPRLGSLDFVQAWLSQCQHDHTTCNEALADDQIHKPLFPRMLIDCFQRRVIPTPRDAAYVCLSYVCGPRLHEFVATISFDPTGYDMPEDLPLTISDAAVVSMKLGHRYLWVDALCISQFDPVAKREEIRNMNVVYSGAELTICATSTDAYSGLPGVSGPPREVPVHADFEGKRLMVVDFEDALPSKIGNTAWSSRAWTYQEMILSRRCLVFHESEVVMECLSRLFRESCDEPTMPVPSAPERHGSSFIDDSSSTLRRALILDRRGVPSRPSVDPPESIAATGKPLKRYSQFTDSLSMYSRRQLSYVTDLLPAFEGALAQMSGDEQMEFVVGMPRQWIPLCLLWSHTLSLERVDLDVPSWSWAAWHYHLGQGVGETSRDRELRRKRFEMLPGGYECVVAPQPANLSWQLDLDDGGIRVHAYCFDASYSLRARPASHPLSDIPELVLLTANQDSSGQLPTQILTAEEAERLKHGDPYNELWQQPHVRPTLAEAALLDGQLRQCVIVVVASSIHSKTHTTGTLLEQLSDAPGDPIQRSFAFRSNTLPKKVGEDVYVRCLLTSETAPGVHERMGVVQILGSRLGGLTLEERRLVLR